MIIQKKILQVLTNQQNSPRYQLVEIRIQLRKKTFSNATPRSEKKMMSMTREDEYLSIKFKRV